MRSPGAGRSTKAGSVVLAGAKYTKNMIIAPAGEEFGRKSRATRFGGVRKREKHLFRIWLGVIQ